MSVFLSLRWGNKSRFAGTFAKVKMRFGKGALKYRFGVIQLASLLASRLGFGFFTGEGGIIIIIKYNRTTMRI